MEEQYNAILRGKLLLLARLSWVVCAAVLILEGHGQSSRAAFYMALLQTHPIDEFSTVMLNFERTEATPTRPYQTELIYLTPGQSPNDG